MKIVAYIASFLAQFDPPAQPVKSTEELLLESPIKVSGFLHLQFAPRRDEERAHAIGQLELVGGAMEVHFNGFEGTHNKRMLLGGM